MTKYTHEEFQELLKEADKRMKQSDGHTYETILKTRCIYCKRSPNQKGTCKAWFSTFIDELTNLVTY
jgi:hypothetical protein